MSERPIRPVARSKEERLYLQEMGEDALLRQQRLAKDSCPECGYPKKVGHHPLCRKAKP